MEIAKCAFFCHFIFLLVVIKFRPSLSCGSRSGHGKRGPRKPLMLSQSIPDTQEFSQQASGPAKGKISRNSPEFEKLEPCYNNGIIFRDEEGTGADRLMSKRCKEKLTTLAGLVKGEWPSVKLVVTEAWDEQDQHSANSLHYEGRAVDLRLSDRDKDKIGLLGRLAVEAGFDWVLYESRSHIHASVREDGFSDKPWDGCFSSDSTVKLQNGVNLQVRNLKVGDFVQVMTQQGKIGFSEVVMFADYKPDIPHALHVLIETKKPAKHITLTPSHLIFTTSNSSGTQLHSKHAGSVLPGEFILVSADGGLVPSQDSQRRMTEVAEDTVIKVAAGQERLNWQQQQLHSNYEDVQRSISFSLKGNVRALNHEKMLIDSGRRQLKEMAKAVKEKLENATIEIQKQDVDRKNNHRRILEDLNKIRNKAEEVWNKIDHSTLQMMSFHSETTQHYNETMQNLKIINDTIAYLLQVTNQMQEKIDDRLSWVTEYLGGTGDKLTLITTCLLHAGYFLLATLCILFLNAPLFTRLVLLVIVPINAWSEIHFNSSLSFNSLSCLLTLALLGNWLYFYLRRKYFHPLENRLCAPRSSPLGSNVVHCFQHKTPSDTEEAEIDLTNSIENLDDSVVPSTSQGPVGNTKRQLNLSLPEAASTPSRKVTTPRRRCGAQTKTGSACKRLIANGSFRCNSHSRIEASYIPDEC